MLFHHHDDGVRDATPALPPGLVEPDSTVATVADTDATPSEREKKWAEAELLREKRQQAGSRFRSPPALAQLLRPPELD